jgi:hypothetical protein
VAGRAYYVEDLALQQLETALRLYAEENNFASAIALAGAVDEIFGKLLQARGRTTSLAEMTKAFVAIQERVLGKWDPGYHGWFARIANHARNRLKHWDVGDHEIPMFDLREEARDMNRPRD